MTRVSNSFKDPSLLQNMQKQQAHKKIYVLIDDIKAIV